MISKHLPKECVSGRPMQGPEGIVIHYFSCKNVDLEFQYDLQRCWDLMVDLNLPRIDRQRYLLDDKSPSTRMYASAHVFIGRGGEVWKLVDFDKQAYHAGKSSLNGRTGCNKWTLGVEMIGHNTSCFTCEQYESLAKFIADLQNKYDIPEENIAGHDQVRYEAILNGQDAKKKYDPSGRPDGTGENFDWERLFYMINRL
jgi:N-acetyl-anhydromuramyl-L-alanine amidase AmpD